MGCDVTSPAQPKWNVGAKLPNMTQRLTEPLNHKNDVQKLYKNSNSCVNIFPNQQADTISTIHTR
jgi:hypothetical protein